MKIKTSLLTVALIFASCVLFLGCGPKQPPSCSWKGTVQLSGKDFPAGAEGTITVSSANATGASQLDSAPIVDGKYHLKQVPLGKVSVHFDVVLQTPSKNAEDAARGIMDVKNLLPKKFKNDFADTADGDNFEKNFDLK